MNEPAQPITHVLEAYKATVFSKNVESFMELYSPDVRVFDLWGGWSYSGAEAWRGAVLEWFGSLGPERVVVDIELVQTFVAQDLAVADAFVVYKAVSDAGEELRAMRNRLTWVIKPESGGWKIVHEHTSAPVDPMTSKVVLEINEMPERSA